VHRSLFRQILKVAAVLIVSQVDNEVLPMMNARNKRLLLAGLCSSTSQEVAQAIPGDYPTLYIEEHREDVLHALELRSYDLVIVDECPEFIDCLRLCGTIRDELHIYDTPILVLLNEVTPSIEDIFQSINVNLFIEKPVTHENLFSILQWISHPLFPFQ